MASLNVNINKQNRSEFLLNIFDTTETGKIIVTFVQNSDKTLSLCATDGVEVWKYGIILQPNSPELARMRQSLSHCQVSLQPRICQLSSTSSSDPQIDLTLAQVSADNDKSLLLQKIIFDLSDSVVTLEKRCDNLNDKLNSQAKQSSKTVFDAGIESKKKKTTTKAAPKPVGMSVVNPGAKKRSAPKGVEFD